MSTLEDTALAELVAAEKFSREEAKRFYKGGDHDRGAESSPVSSTGRIFGLLFVTGCGLLRPRSTRPR